METNPQLQMVLDTVVSVFLFLTALAALVGVYKAHIATGGATFGSTTGSLSLIAFAISVSLWKKSL